MGPMVLLFVAVVILAALNWYKRRWEALQILKKNGIPGPEPDFFTGNFKQQLKSKNVPRQGQWLKEYGDVHGYYSGTRPSVVIKDIELLKNIQIKDFQKFHSRKIFRDCGGIDAHSRSASMLIFQEGQRWKEVRSILTPTFNASKMKQTTPMINDAIDAMLENINEKSKEGDFDIYELFQGLTMDTIGRSAFGIKTNVQRNPDDEFFKAAQTAFSDQINNQFLKNLLFVVQICFPEFGFLLYPLRWLEFRVLEKLGLSHNGILYDVSKQIVDARRKNLADSNNPWSRVDLLQGMLNARAAEQSVSQLTAGINQKEPDAEKVSVSKGKAEKFMTDTEIVANSVLFFEAGYETTSTALGFVAHILVNRQDIQDRMRKEINELLEREGKLDYNTVTELTYMEAVLFETMRMYPPITQFVTREAAEDYACQTKDGKSITIPKGCGVVVPVYYLHHDPELWEDPEKFDETRFLPENRKHNPLAWQPFGAGPRNCIGLRFALLEAKLALARLIQAYRLVPGPRTEGPELEVDFKPISMTPKKGVFVKAEKI